MAHPPDHAGDSIWGASNCLLLRVLSIYIYLHMTHIYMGSSYLRYSLSTPRRRYRYTIYTNNDLLHCWAPGAVHSMLTVPVGLRSKHFLWSKHFFQCIWLQERFPVAEKPDLKITSEIMKNTLCQQVPGHIAIKFMVSRLTTLMCLNQSSSVKIIKKIWPFELIL